MIKLSDRLQLMADMIKKGETMADIGTDHGFLPIYLVERDISPKSIMCDISVPSLNKARDAAREDDLMDSTRVDFREGDGLEPIENGEVDAVVIAGMGGILISEILGKDIDKTRSISKYILQPRNNAGYLRHWLSCKGFKIAQNVLVREGKFICEIILAIPPKSLQNSFLGLSECCDEDSPSWDMPEDMKENSEDILKDFVALKISKEQKKIRGLTLSKSTNDREIKKSEERIEYFSSFLKEVPDVEI